MKKAFTLIEIMVVITLIGIIALGVSNIDFNKLSDRQRLDGFFYEIKTNIENIQNNALIGKAIKTGTSTDLEVPKKWKIDFNNSGSGKIISNYSIDGINYTKYNEIIPKRFYGIVIKYYNSSIWEKIDNSDTGTLLIEGGNLTLSGITVNSKKLKIDINYKEFKKSFTINTISGVIEEK